ncbi:MAG: sigma 54-interacting transcriptional regulator [candidate division WOR-3 bacterium]
MRLATELKRILVQLRLGLGSARSPGERLQVLNESSFLLERHSEAEAPAFVEEMVACAETSGDVLGATTGLWALAEHARRCGDLARATQYARRLLQTASRAGASETEALARLLEGRVFEYSGEFETARECYERAFALWQRAKATEGCRIALRHICGLMLRQGLTTSAMKFCQEALGIDPDNQNRLEQAAGLLDMGRVFVQMGNWEDAAEYLFRSVGIAEKHGFSGILHRASNALGEMFLRRDRPERAVEYFSKVVQAARRSETDFDAMCEGLVGLASAYYASGDLAAAERTLQEGSACCPRCGDSATQSALHRVIAELALAKGELAEAESSAQKALEVAQRAGVHCEVGRVLSVLGQVAAERDDIDAAMAFFQQSLKSFERIEVPYDLGRIRLQYGRLLLNAGRVSESGEQLREAERIFRELGVAGQIAEASRLLFRTTSSETGDVALLAAVAGLAALRLEPSSFLERALRLICDGLSFDCGAIVVGKRPVAVCGEPQFGAVSDLRADGEYPVVSETTLCFPVRFDGGTLAWVCLERATPTKVSVQPLLLQGLASLLALQVMELATRSRRPGVRSGLVAGLRYRGVVGRSPKVLSALEIVAKVASVPIPVLMRGESGTGKELIARALHDSGSRSRGPFVAVNCAAMPETLLESEFFGVAKGAATGVSPRKGKFELADGGTIFLDEIGDMSPALQAKLLRVLQGKCFERVGGDQTITVDVRVVAATNQNLEERMEKGLFRRDLYYRLNGVEIELPALRERREDIPELVRHFVDRFAREFGRQVRGVSSETLQALVNHSWPGNIRELQNVIERAVVMCKESELGLHDLPPEFRGINPEEEGLPKASFLESGDFRSSRRKVKDRAVSELEKVMIVDCLIKADWNISKAAELAGYSRAQFYRLIKKHNISRP